MNQRKLAKDRGLIYKYPRAFCVTVVSAALLVFFSRPIYDVFTFRRDSVNLEELIRTHKSRFSK